jgi:hypothetical protein
MEHRQRICVSEPKSQPEDLERHLVHSDNHGSSVLDLRISLKDIDEEYTNVVTARQRKEERGRRLNKGDIEVLSDYLPEAVGSSLFDPAIHVPVDTAEMDGESLGAIVCPLLLRMGRNQW